MPKATISNRVPSGHVTHRSPLALMATALMAAPPMAPLVWSVAGSGRPPLQLHVLRLVRDVHAEQEVRLPPQRLAVGFGDGAFQVVRHRMRGDEEVEHMVDRRLAGQAVKLAPRLAQHRRGVRQFEEARGRPRGEARSLRGGPRLNNLQRDRIGDRHGAPQGHGRCRYAAALTGRCSRAAARAAAGASGRIPPTPAHYWASNTSPLGSVRVSRRPVSGQVALHGLSGV